MKNIFVGMSGGVDSSVTAALLQEQGHSVTGVFIRGWYPEWLPCSWRDERRDAMRVCAHLGLPFLTCDMEEVYKKEVVDYMIAEYAAGRTPNPDIMCNKHVKFGGFFAWAREQGADLIATGHYARIGESPETGKQKKAELLAGMDTHKDQSYFLWGIDREVLAHTLFPLGGYEKAEVRNLAERYKLPTASKKDSQGICFLGKIDMREFLKHYIEVAEGAVLDTSGNQIGTHEGALLYTLGQRHGFTVTDKAPDAGPWYVVAKDVEHNTLTVAESYDQQTARTTEVTLRETNWLSAPPPQEKRQLQCRFRYRQPLMACTLSEQGTQVVFGEPQHAIASGQSLVVYDRDVCLGGGIVV